MSQAPEERRRDTRFAGDVLAGARATVRPACTVTLVDLSQGGALVEAARPLRPGARVHLQLQRGARQFLVAAHIVRCAVFALGGDEGVVSRGAMRFEERCEELWDACTRAGYPGPELEKPLGPEAGPDVPRRLRAERTRARE